MTFELSMYCYMQLFVILLFVYIFCCSLCTYVVVAVSECVRVCVCVNKCSCTSQQLPLAICSMSELAPAVLPPSACVWAVAIHIVTMCLHRALHKAHVYVCAVQYHTCMSTGSQKSANTCCTCCGSLMCHVCMYSYMCTCIVSCSVCFTTRER